MSEQWREHAACLDQDSTVFFPDTDLAPRNPDRWSAARAICGRCTAKVACLADAMAEEGSRSASHRFGVRAGLTPSQRWGLRQRRRGEAA